MVSELSILIGGKAGEGVRSAGQILAHLFNLLGFRIFVYEDYPSLIKGGHNFSVIRASLKVPLATREKVDILFALDEKTIIQHKKRLKKTSQIIYNSNKVSSKGLGIPIEDIIKEYQGTSFMKNAAVLGALVKTLGIRWTLLEKLIKNKFKKDQKKNILIAKKSYRLAKNLFNLKPLSQKPLPLLSGNEAIALGAIKAGLKMYIAYPMTPATSILHYLAGRETELNVKTVQPENEIAAATMALGTAYAGVKTMVGTSGGGFALMTETLSLAAQSEVPFCVVLSQRPGPATGVPTYTMQGDLFFALGAGHGNFIRFLTVPGDSEEAFYWTGKALNITWKYQIPAIILVDKHLSESIFSFNPNIINQVKEEKISLWKRKGNYKRYLNTKTGISPLAFPGNPSATIKVTSYEHDEYGITTEEQEKVKLMQEKRLKKLNLLKREIDTKKAVKIYGNQKSSTALISWGSTKGVVQELAEALNVKLIQPLVLEPFPLKTIKKALKGVKKLIDIEVNINGDLARLINRYGINPDRIILKYDGRPFELEELYKKLKNIV